MPYLDLEDSYGFQGFLCMSIFSVFFQSVLIDVVIEELVKLLPLCWKLCSKMLRLHSSQGL